MQSAEGEYQEDHADQNAKPDLPLFHHENSIIQVVFFSTRIVFEKKMGS